jgi:hypothetical protein
MKPASSAHQSTTSTKDTATTFTTRSSVEPAASLEKCQRLLDDLGISGAVRRDDEPVEVGEQEVREYVVEILQVLI